MQHWLFFLVILLLVIVYHPLVALIPEQGMKFQQGVEYRIEAMLDEPMQLLRGRARLRYTNNSPDQLDTLFVHRHLNAFRPNSAWARRKLQFGERRFQNLGPDEHAFERFTGARVDKTPVAPVYPGTFDSTVAAISLPEVLPPGGPVTVEMDWVARLATVSRRQGREDRHFDLAQWYPRIVVYDTAGSRGAAVSRCCERAKPGCR